VFAWTGLRLYIFGIMGGVLAGGSVTPSMQATEAEQELPERFEATPGDTTFPAAGARYKQQAATYEHTRTVEPIQTVEGADLPCAHA